MAYTFFLFWPESVMRKSILVVEDDCDIRQLLQLNLSMTGYEVVEAPDALQAHHSMAKAVPDLILVDWNMPGQSGVSFVRRVRTEFAQRMIPIIMITARDHEQDKVLAFESGVDDYLTKPFKLRELLARVEALLRRSTLGGTSQVIEIDGLCLDHACRQVKVANKEIAMGPTEYKLLHFLVCHPMRVHSRQQLLNHVWGDSAELQDRTVDAYIGRLRNLMHASGHHPCIETVRSTGYRFIKRSELGVQSRKGQDRRQGDRRAIPRTSEHG